jgi:maltose 6'-phosphate phosphatase
MNAHLKFLKYSILLTVAFFLLPYNVSAWWWWNEDYQCDEVATDGGVLNVMTINLLFSEIKNRDLRLAAIAKFAHENNIHVIMLQEVVGGLLVGTQNSAKDLQDILQDYYGLNYNLKTAFETGLPGLLAVANAVLSRCEIRFSLVKRLSRQTEVEFDGRVIKLSRNVQMVRLKIPGYPRVSVYNTHWCAGCAPEELAINWQESFNFLNNVENFLGDGLVILGGDFNLDRLRTDIELDLYDAIIFDQGFRDAYADFVIDSSAGSETLDTLCEDKDDPDEHCTVDVTPLGGSGSRRIDYLFIRNLDDAIGAQVVFTPFNPTWTNTVSDHAAVVMSLNPN